MRDLSNTLLAQLGIIKDIVEEKMDDGLTEIMLNPDGSLWYTQHGTSINHGPLDKKKAYSIIRLLAGVNSLTVTKENPLLSVKLNELGGGRFEAMIPPVVTGPTFAIRFPKRNPLSLENLTLSRTITFAQQELLSEAVINKKNIIICGGTDSGKTTLATALMKLITKERVILIEDNPEITVNTDNCVSMKTTEKFTLREAVQKSLRLRPDRIIIGEIRDGGTALDLCKAWLTGHPGGIGTIHASSAESCIDRIYSLMGEVTINPSMALIRESIDLIVYIAKQSGTGKLTRKVEKIIEVQE